MRIQNHNFMQGMNQMADQVQRSAQAEQALRQVRIESEIETKMRKLSELMDAKGKQVQNAVDPAKERQETSQHEFTMKHDGGGEGTGTSKPEVQTQPSELPQKPARASHIDIRV
jgi:hypothetical protein